MTKAQARQRVLKALAAVGCRGRRNDHDITHVPDFEQDRVMTFCRIIFGDRWSRFKDEIFRLDGFNASYYPVNASRERIETIGDLVEVVRAARPL